MENHLIDNWLLSCNQKYFDFEEQKVDVKHLPIFLNLLMASVTKRLVVYATEIEASKSILLNVDRDLQEFSEEMLARFFKELSLNDEFYIGYCDFLVYLVREIIESKSYSYLSELILNTEECRGWRKQVREKKYQIDLIDGWKHPWSRDKIINGNHLLNSWGYASLFAGLATKRFKKGNTDKAIHRLVQMNILKVEEIYTRLACCTYLDSDYLELLEQIQKKLQQQTLR
jgi:hypothetical protein